MLLQLFEKVLCNFVLFVKTHLAICKSRNGESGNGMGGMMGTRGIRVGTRRIKVEIRGMGVGMLGMRGMRRITVGIRGMGGGNA